MGIVTSPLSSFAQECSDAVRHLMTVTAMSGLSRHDLLKRNENAPMLVINGTDDYFVPQADTLVFTGRRDTEVRLLPNTGHCAVSKMPAVMSTAMGWLTSRLG